MYVKPIYKVELLFFEAASQHNIVVKGLRRLRQEVPQNSIVHAHIFIFNHAVLIYFA